MKPKAGLPPHTSTVLDVPLAVSTRVVVGTDTRGHATHVARAETVLFSAGVSHTWLTTMFPTLPLAGGVLSPRYWWSQGMVVGAKESEGEARHAGAGACGFACDRMRFGRRVRVGLRFRR